MSLDFSPSLFTAGFWLLMVKRRVRNFDVYISASPFDQQRPRGDFEQKWFDVKGECEVRVYPQAEEINLPAQLCFINRGIVVMGGAVKGRDKCALFAASRTTGYYHLQKI